jgi:chemotaxis protein CheZ
MAAPRKVFRIEQMAASRRETPTGDAPAPGLDDIMQELGALRAMVAAEPARQAAGPSASRHDEVERLAAKLRLIRLTIIGAEPDQAGRNEPRAPGAPTTRIAQELQAVMKGSEQATQKILAAAEEIDQAANNLSAALRSDSEQGLAQDIRDRVIAIFEACNFQDLTSQRVAKVMATLGRIELQIARALDELTRNAAPLANGPGLEGDCDHVSQSDVDDIFSGWNVKSA